MEKRTDLAMEANEIWREGAGEAEELAGVESSIKNVSGFDVTTVKILDMRGAEALGKPQGTYVTLELGALIRREDSAFRRAAEVLRDIISALVHLEDRDGVLVAGLGNFAITPDAVGPLSVRSTVVTRHLTTSDRENFGQLRPTAAVETGVAGTTGFESAELIAAMTEKLKPSLVIAIDALASRSMDRLCRTVQISDTGIVPGSGVGNARKAINADTLGVPVIAIGVPTVVDAATLALELLEKSGVKAPDRDALAEKSDGMIVTPRGIDKSVADVSKLIGYAVSLALQPELTLEDVTMLLE